MEAVALQRSHAAILEELHTQVMAGQLDLDVARIERFRRLFESAGVDADRTLAAEAAQTYRRRYLESRRAVTGAATLLEMARQRARIGIVSNNLLEEQRDKLRCCKLDQYVDVLVVSEEAGVSKPDPRIFRIALERLECRADQAVMVGDSWSADIVGASGAGIRAIWFNRDNAATPSDPADVSVIHTLEPAPDVLEKIFGEVTKERGTARLR